MCGKTIKWCWMMPFACSLRHGSYVQNCLAFDFTRSVPRVALPAMKYLRQTSAAVLTTVCIYLAALVFKSWSYTSTFVACWIKICNLCLQFLWIDWMEVATTRRTELWYSVKVSRLYCHLVEQQRCSFKVELAIIEDSSSQGEIYCVISCAAECTMGL